MSRPHVLFSCMMLCCMSGKGTTFPLSKSASVRQTKQYFFTIAAIFKNEATIVQEWVTHYLQEGADHIFLVDNDSSDDFIPFLQPFIDVGQVTLMFNAKRHAQQEILTNYILPLRHMSEWMMTVDLDEFVYARSGTVPDFLREMPNRVCSIHVPWKMFGSSGHKKQPVGSVVKNFSRRDNTTSNDAYKAIFRSSSVSEIHIHDAVVNGETVTLKIGSACGGSQECIQSYQSSSLAHSAALQLNHYAIQSLQWFVSTKMTRGDNSNADSDQSRDFAYFERYDAVSNEIEDTDLYLKHQKYFDSL